MVVPQKHWLPVRRPKINKALKYAGSGLTLTEFRANVGSTAAEGCTCLAIIISLTGCADVAVLAQGSCTRVVGITSYVCIAVYRRYGLLDSLSQSNGQVGNKYQQIS